MLRYLRAGGVLTLLLATSYIPAQAACSSCTGNAPALVTPVPLLPYTEGTQDYRPAINAASTEIVFEREFYGSTGYGAPNLYIANLKSRTAVKLAPGVSPSARADWCWPAAQPDDNGPITFSQGETGPVYTMPPRAGAQTRLVPNSSGKIYPTWYPGCKSLALYSINSIIASSFKGPTTLKVDARTGAFEKNATGATLWAGFPSVKTQNPNLVAFAGQQFTLNNPAATCQPGYDQNCNYIYIANSASTPPRVYPLDRYAPVNMYNPDYEGRAPTWSPDGKWIAFESNRLCIKSPASNASFYQIFIQDSAGLQAAQPVTACMYNAQHAKWYRRPINGRHLLIVSVLAYPVVQAGAPPSHLLAREISSLDVTAFVAE